MNDSVTIIGDGQMALVMADAIAHRGATVRIWSPFPDDARKLAQTRKSDRLPGFVLPPSVEMTADVNAAFNGAHAIVSAIPTQFLRDVWSKLGPHVSPGIPIISVTKGIEIGTALRPTQVIDQSIEASTPNRQISKSPNRQIPLVALSGPAIAAELARRLPASLVAASNDDASAQFVQELLRVPWLRVYRHSDVIGVEMAGATKNIIAIAAGMIDGLEAGANAKSALLARGLAEIARLGVAMGAKIDTFFGIAGVGDLATTCFSPEGRNRTCGERLARGQSLDSVLSSMNSVVEGVPTTRAVMQMARDHHVEMPITSAVYAILFEGLTPRDAIRELMSRELKAEHIG